MISRALETEILRLYHSEHWLIGTIATQLRVHHGTVRRVLAQAGVPVAQTTVRPSIAAPYVAFMIETLTKYPTLRASRLYQMVKERGYPGAPDHFRAIVAQMRPRRAPAAPCRDAIAIGSRWCRSASARCDTGAGSRLRARG